jgi:hypothetical protein
MSCPVCHKLQCECRSSTGGIFAGFSLVGGDYPGGSIIGNPESSFIVDCPPGVICAEGQYPVVVRIGEDEIEFPYTLHPPPGFPITLRLPCNGSEIVRTFPAGTTTEELLLAVALMIAECGQQRANNQGWGGVEFRTAVGNDIVTVGCPDDKQIRVVSAWSGFEGVSVSGTNLQVASGLFSVIVAPFTGEATTLEAGKELANQRAEAYGQSAFDALLANGNIECGWWNTEQTLECPDGSIVTAAAMTFFSTVSQADADEQAEASLPEECITVCNEAFNDLSWTLSVGACGPDGFAGSGAGAHGSLSAGPFAWACPLLTSDSVFIAGTVDCDITVSGSRTGDGDQGSARLFVNGVNVKQYDFANPSGTNDVVHINGTAQNWQFQLRASTPSDALNVAAEISVFLGS